MSAAAELGLKDRGDRAAAFVLRPQLEAIKANFDGALDGEDPEQLHDLRVAVRRTRAVQRQLGPILPGGLARWRREFRWLQRSTGDARDLDVYVLGFDKLRDFVSAPSRPALDPVLEVLHHRRREARAAMTRALREPRCRELLESWEGFLVELEAANGARGQVPIGAFSDKRIRKLFRRVFKMGRAIDSSSSPKAYHELRKQGKELRYMLELFASRVRPAEVVKPMVKSLKSLQDTLGRHQDREVQIATLASVREALAGGYDCAPALAAIDELIDRLHDDELDARAEFAERFAAFAAKPQRALVQDVFA